MRYPRIGIAPGFPIAGAPQGRGRLLRVTTALVVAALALLPAAAGGSVTHAAPGAKKIDKIVYVKPLPDTPDWGRSGRYLKQACPKLGCQATVVGPSTLDLPGMVTDIQDAITSKPDIIMTCACGAGAFDAVERKARKAKITVVNIAADSAPNARDLFFGTNYKKLGKQAARLLIQKTHGQGHILIVQTNGTTQNQVQEISAFRKVIASHPGMQIVSQVFDNSDAAVAAPKMSTALVAHPDINVIWTVEGAAPGAVQSVLKQAGKKPGQVTVLAIDLQIPTKQAIRQGWIWATLYQQFFDATPLAAKCAIAIRQGKHVPHVFDTGALVITKSNIPTSLPPKNGTLPKNCP